MDTASNQLVELIREITRDEMSKKDDTSICYVQSVNDNGTLNLQLLSDVDTIVENIPNNSAYQFESGDYAILYKIDNNLSNAFVIAKVTNVPPEIVQKISTINNIVNVSGGGGNIPTKTSELTNDGENGTSPYATENFVNSSVATNTAYFRGTYNIVTDLGLTTSASEQQIATALANKMTALSITPTNNDYCFVAYPDATDPTQYTKYDRYKYDGADSSWGYEYTLNNSSFTAAQWAVINSGITGVAQSQSTSATNVPSNNLLLQSSFARVYRSLSELSGISTTSTILQVMNAMVNDSYLEADVSSYSNIIPDSTFANGVLEIVKRNVNRCLARYTALSNSADTGVAKTWFGEFQNAVSGHEWSGWKEVITSEGAQTITGTKTLKAPSGTTTLVIDSVNGDQSISFRLNGTEHSVWRGSSNGACIVGESPSFYFRKKDGTNGFRIDTTAGSIYPETSKGYHLGKISNRFSDMHINGVRDFGATAAGSCNTGGDSAAKVATCYDITALETNGKYYIYFNNANSYQGALTLNINSYGAKPIYINNSASSSSNYTLSKGWHSFQYNGTAFYTIPDAVHEHNGGIMIRAGHTFPAMDNSYDFGSQYMRFRNMFVRGGLYDYGSQTNRGVDSNSNYTGYFLVAYCNVNTFNAGCARIIAQDWDSGSTNFEVDIDAYFGFNTPTNQDLTASGFTPTDGKYYKHTGATTSQFTNGHFYYYTTANGYTEVTDLNVYTGKIGVSNSFGANPWATATNNFFLVMRATSLTATGSNHRIELWYKQTYTYGRYRFTFLYNQGYSRTDTMYKWTVVNSSTSTDQSYVSGGVVKYVDANGNPSSSTTQYPTFIPTASWGASAFPTSTYPSTKIFNNTSTINLSAETIASYAPTPNFNAIMRNDSYTVTPSSIQSAQYLARDKDGNYMGGIRFWHYGSDNTAKVNQYQVQLFARHHNTTTGTYVCYEADSGSDAAGKTRFMSNTNGYTDLGAPGSKWRDLYLSGIISDGASSATVSDIINSRPYSLVEKYTVSAGATQTLNLSSMLGSATFVKIVGYGSWTIKSNYATLRYLNTSGTVETISASTFNSAGITMGMGFNMECQVSTATVGDGQIMGYCSAYSKISPFFIDGGMSTVKFTNNASVSSTFKLYTLK